MKNEDVKAGDLIQPLWNPNNETYEVIGFDNDYEYSPGRYGLKVKSETTGLVSYIGSRFTNATLDSFERVETEKK